MNLDEYLFFISQNIQDAVILVENNIVVYYTKSLETIFSNKLNNICDIKKDISKLLCNEHSNVLKNYNPYEEANFRFKVNLGNRIYK